VSAADIRGALCRNLGQVAAPLTIRDAKARQGGAQCVKLTNPAATPIIRESAAKLGDPDDGGQVTQTAARLSDPDDGGQ
jgi:hypothetical protein